MRGLTYSWSTEIQSEYVKWSKKLLGLTALVPLAGAAETYPKPQTVLRSFVALSTLGAALTCS
jgi:hypothetical protein